MSQAGGFFLWAGLTAPTTGVQPVEPWVCRNNEADVIANQPKSAVWGASAALIATLSAAPFIHRPVYAAPQEPTFVASSVFGSSLPLRSQAPQTPRRGVVTLPAEEPRFVESVYQHPIPVPVDYNAPNAVIRGVAETPEFVTSSVNRFFPVAPVASRVPPPILKLAAELNPEQQPSLLFKQAPNQPTQPYQIIRTTVQSSQEVPEALYSQVSHTLPFQPAKPRPFVNLGPVDPEQYPSILFKAPPLQSPVGRPFLVLEFQLPEQVVSTSFKATQFPTLQSPPARTTPVLDFALPIEGSAKVSPFFPGNFPALQSPPLKPTFVLDYQVPEQFPSVWIPPNALFIPSVAPEPPKLGGGHYPAKRKYVVRVDGKLLVFYSKADALASIPEIEPVVVQLATIKAVAKSYNKTHVAQALIKKKDYSELIAWYEALKEDEDDIEMLLLSL